MGRKKLIILIITLAFFLTLVIYTTYAFFVMGSFNISNAVNVNILTDDNNMVFDVLGGQMSLTVDGSLLKSSTAGNVVAQNTSTLTVNFQPNTTSNMVCNYDIVYEWTSNDRYLSNSPGITDNEFTIQASLARNSHVSMGINHIESETDFSVAVGYQSSTKIVQSAQIDGSGSTTSTAVWTLNSKFYNANGNQSSLAGKTLSGKFKVANVICKSGTKSTPLSEYITYDALESGTSSVGNTAWSLVSDHPNEWRYVGKNPDNYISFNGELWRIIGVMPNMTYCTGSYGNADECNTTSNGSLVKIIRNQSIRSSNIHWDYKQVGVGSSTNQYGSNDWSDSQLMLMLNGKDYLKTGHDVNGNKLHTSYTITNNVISGNGHDFYNATYSYLDGKGTTVYTPSSATTSSYSATTGSLYKKIEGSALSQIATVKWDLYGDSSTSNSTSAYYDKERNIGNNGLIHTDTQLSENRAVYWYGKIGLMYPSDYGYATGGGSTYNRNTCLGYQMSSWNSGSYKTDCAANDWLWYTNITSSAPGSSGETQWLLTPNTVYSCDVYYLLSTGNVAYIGASAVNIVRPTLYLKPNVVITGGTGKWNDPYTIEMFDIQEEINNKSYWFALSTWNGYINQYEPLYTHPSYGGTLQTNGSATGHNVYIGQDNSKYYACLTYQGHEICLSQPYTQYGLSGHTLETPFTYEQQESAKQALYQVFTDAGMDQIICSSDERSVTCDLGGLRCDLGAFGSIECYDYSQGERCEVDYGGHAFCET